MIKATHISSKPREDITITTHSTKKKYVWLLYYLCVIAIVGWKVTDTLITSATVIGHRNELRSLSREYEDLTQQKSKYLKTLTVTQSLAYAQKNSNTISSEFVPISNTISLNLTQYLAQN